LIPEFTKDLQRRKSSSIGSFRKKNFKKTLKKIEQKKKREKEYIEITRAIVLRKREREDLVLFLCTSSANRQRYSGISASEVVSRAMWSGVRTVCLTLTPDPSCPPTTQRKLKNAAAAQPESIFAGAVTWHGFVPRGPMSGRDERISLRLCSTGRRHDICVRVGGTTVRGW